MLTAARECPSCHATLPADAAFCHKCGSATPTAINQATGEIQALEASGVAESARRAALQAALGDSCEVRRLLGRGGFAEVYVAFDKRLKREIAVKTIRGDLVVNETLLERFQREAEAVAKLRHSNVVPIYSVGESGGLAYFTMPLIEGESLAAVLERDGRLPVRDAVRILREAANALHAAHRVGIVHRDVKPDNIMLEDPERSVVVMDFGIAKSAGGDAKGLTGTGMLVGTPHYMSPEQAMGEQSLDARSDQYALATVGYRMLTGRAPFEGDSVQTLIFKIVTEVPPPARGVDPEIPGELSDALAKALSKRPDDRYASMAEFAAALSSVEQRASSDAVPSRGRKRVELAARVRAMEVLLPGARMRAFVAAAVIIAAATVFVVGTPRAPFVVAGARDDAVFAAKTFLNSRNVPASRSEFEHFETRDTAFRFLRDQLGFEGMQQRAMQDIPVWRWRISSVSPAAKDAWKVFVGPGNRIVGFEQTILDTASGARLSADSARVLAEQELAARGWPASRLARLGDSTITRKARTDHVFRWRQTDSAIASPKDSAFVRLSATVSGDRVTKFDLGLRMPDGYIGARSEMLFAVMVLGVVLGIVLAVVIIVRRQQMDELQWAGLIRVAVVVALVILVQMSPGYYEDAVTARAAGGGIASQLMLTVVLTTFLTGCGLCVAVAAESFAYGQRPEVVAGIGDVARGRFAIPEMIPAASQGYLYGSLGGLCTALGLLVAIRFGVGASTSPELPFSGVPFVNGLLLPAILALLIVCALLFTTAVCARLPVISKGAFLVPAVVCGLALLVYGENPGIALSTATTVGLVTYVLWRHGVLAGIIAYLVADSMTRASTLIRTGDAHSLLAAAATIAVAAAPAGLAIIARRRFVTTPAN